MSQTDRLSSTFAALADPTRRAILERLACGEATLNQLAEPFPMSLQAVSQHLEVLELRPFLLPDRDTVSMSRFSGPPCL